MTHQLWKVRFNEPVASDVHYVVGQEVFFMEEEARRLIGSHLADLLLIVDENGLALPKTLHFNNMTTLALQTTWPVLIEAPGLTKLIVPIFAMLIGDFAAGHYNNIDIDNAELFVAIGDDEAEPLGHLINATGLAASGAASGVTTFFQNDSPIAMFGQHHATPLVTSGGGSVVEQALLYTDTANWVNKPLVLGMYNNGADMEDGHVNNSLTVILQYALVDINS